VPVTSSTEASGVASCQISPVASVVASAIWAISPAVLMVVPSSIVPAPTRVCSHIAITLALTSPVTVNKVRVPIAPELTPPSNLILTSS